MQPRMTVDIGRFLGLKRITVIYVVIFLLCLTWASTLYQIHEIQTLATRNSTAVNALCIFRSDLIQRRDANQKFLDLSPRQRIEKYGDLGKIPLTIVRSNIKAQNQTIASLDSLRCK